jgi:hypothetical protein
MVNNSSNINKTKESLKCESTIPPISTKQKKVETVMVDNSTNINKAKESLNSDGRQFHQYQQKKRKLKQ